MGTGLATPVPIVCSQQVMQRSLRAGQFHTPFGLLCHAFQAA